MAVSSNRQSATSEASSRARSSCSKQSRLARFFFFQVGFRNLDCPRKAIILLPSRLEELLPMPRDSSIVPSHAGSRSCCRGVRICRQLLEQAPPSRDPCALCPDYIWRRPSSFCFATLYSSRNSISSSCTVSWAFPTP